MPRAFLKTKNRGGHHSYRCTRCGETIEAGQKYYTWKFNRGSRFFQHAEHGPPLPSQLTHSKMAEVLDAVHTADFSEVSSIEDIKAILQEVASAGTSVADQYNESADTIESSWPNGNPTSEACRNTASELEDWVSSLENWEPQDDEFDAESHDSEEEWLEAEANSAEELVNEHPEYQG